MEKISLDFMFANTPTGTGKTYTRPERQPTIFDYLMSSSEERSQAPLVLLGKPNGEPHMMNNTKAWDNVKERKLQRLLHEYTTNS